MYHHSFPRLPVTFTGGSCYVTDFAVLPFPCHDLTVNSHNGPLLKPGDLMSFLSENHNRLDVKKTKKTAKQFPLCLQSQSNLLPQ